MRKNFLILFSFALLVAVACSTAERQDVKPQKTAVQEVDAWQTASADQLGVFTYADNQAALDAQVMLVQNDDPPAESESKGGLFQSLGGEVWNIALYLLTTVLAVFYGKARVKVKLVGELFIKAHEYTDDNRLTEAERTDLMNRFLVIIGKKKVEQLE